MRMKDLAATLDPVEGSYLSTSCSPGFAHSGRETLAFDRMADDDAWALFGDDATAAPVVPPIVPPKRPRHAADVEAAAVAALAPFLDHCGDPVVVPPHPSKPSSSGGGGRSTYAGDVWPERKCVVTGPIDLQVFDACGRGFIASRDVAVGEVLMIERPLVRWASAERSPLSLLRTVLEQRTEDVDFTLKMMQRLHPTVLEGIALERKAALEEQHRDTIDALLPQWTPGGSGSPRDELLRLCLAVQWNCFDSGLFLHQAIFNHAPARDANADKAAMTLDGDLVSVVRATRRIRQGEQCLISYLQPAELSRASSTARLRQFDFACTPPAHPDWDRPPRSCVGGRDDVDARTLQLEAQADAALGHLRLKRAGALDAATAAIGALVAELGARHLSVACARRQLVGAIRRVLELERHEGGAEDAALETALLLALLENALELWQTQRELLGPLHPECATTLNHIGTALAQAITRAPQELCSRFGEAWGTPRLASLAEHHAMQLSNQIARLYDVER